jgi:pimeloyl-ACP methyl ester carboxylesterase
MHAIRTIFFLALVTLAAAACRSKPPVAFTDLKYPMATRTVRVGTAEIAYHDTGSGERTLLLVHGLGSSMTAWSKNLEALARDHRVVVVDLPGYGKSTKANYEYTMRFFAKAIRGVVRELDLQRVVLVGHSMGGQIAMTYALDYPGTVEALVLTSPAGLEPFNDGEARWLAGMTTPAFTCNADDEAVWTRHVQNFHRAPKDAEFMVADRLAVRGGPDFADYCVAVSRSVAGMLDEPVVERLPEIDVPVLVVFGDADALIPNPFLHGGSTVRLAKKAVDRFADAQLVLLEKAGHMAQFERAEQWNREVLQFLRSHDDAPTPGRARRRPRTAPGRSVVPLFDPGTDPDDAPRDEAPRAEPEPTPTPEPSLAPTPTSDPDPAATPADTAPTTPTRTKS